MLVGILESKNERFINDVVSQLNDIHIEFICTVGEIVPIRRNYQVIVDRLSFRYPFLKEMLKSLSLNGVYIINNPFTSSLTNKVVEINLGNRLGLPFPKTVILPDQSSIDETEGIVSQPPFEQITEEIGLPCILKPFDGYAWEDVQVVNSIEELSNIYHSLFHRRVLIVQQLIGFQKYFRAFCFDKRDVLFIKWIPKPLAMGQYLYSDVGVIGDAEYKLTELTIQLNKALDFDVNVVEWCVDEEGKWWVIDAFNEVPEVIPDALPSEYYAWIVERFASCIREKLNSGKSNCIPFG